MPSQDGELPRKEAPAQPNGHSVEGMKEELRNQFSISATPVGVNSPQAPMSPGGLLHRSRRAAAAFRQLQHAASDSVPRRELHRDPCTVCCCATVAHSGGS